jgi:hypothetical protein
LRFATRRRNYASLQNTAAFVDVDQIDVAATFALTHRAWLHHAPALADELAAAEPPGAFAQRVAEHIAAADAVDQGLLLRSLFVARRPLPRHRRKSTLRHDATASPKARRGESCLILEQSQPVAVKGGR